MISTGNSILRAAVLAALALGCGAGPALAAAPMAKTQAPGFYRTMLGEFEVTALNDGTVDLPVDKLLHSKPERTVQALSRVFLKTPLETSVNAYLINTGSKLVLIDTGAAGLFGPTLGKLAANLKAAGYQPEQVDEIYLTHMHPDHVGGLVTGGRMAFPNAVVRAEKHDADYWLSKVNLEKAPADKKASFQGPIGALSPYADVGKLQVFEGDTELAPGISARTSFGHTPGHTSYVIQSKGQKLVLLGDLVHVQAVQFDDPGVTIDFDSDPKSAAKQRRAAFAEAAKQGYLIGAAHLQFPGLGHVRANGLGASAMSGYGMGSYVSGYGMGGYQFVPVNYTQPR